MTILINVSHEIFSFINNLDPFNDNILASAYEDNSVFIWKIPEGDIKENITKEFQIYKKHTNKVNYIIFNPIVDILLC